MYLCWNISSERDILVGHAAVAQQEKNAANTIYDAKRFIGKRFTGPELEKESLRYQFKVSVDYRYLSRLRCMS